MNNQKPIGSGEFAPSSESARKTPTDEIPELKYAIEQGNEALAGHERITEEPKNEIMPEETPDLTDYQDTDSQTDTQREISHIEQMLKRYPKDEQIVFDETDGIQCISLGKRTVSEEIKKSVVNAKSVLRHTFGVKLGNVFKGLRVFYTTGEIETAGWTYSGANVILMDHDKNALSIGAAEQLLGPHMINILDAGDWGRIVEDRGGLATISGETTLVHEFGHMFQSKTNTTFTDTNKSPTKYGRSKEWEDYAESFLYYCYRKPLEGNRTAQFSLDIASITKNV